MSPKTARFFRSLGEGATEAAATSWPSAHSKAGSRRRSARPECPSRQRLWSFPVSRSPRRDRRRGGRRERGAGATTRSNGASSPEASSSAASDSSLASKFDSSSRSPFARLASCSLFRDDGFESDLGRERRVSCSKRERERDTKARASLHSLGERGKRTSLKEKGETKEVERSVDAALLFFADLFQPVLPLSLSLSSSSLLPPSFSFSSSPTNHRHATNGSTSAHSQESPNRRLPLRPAPRATSATRPPSSASGRRARLLGRGERPRGEQQEQEGPGERGAARAGAQEEGQRRRRRASSSSSSSFNSALNLFPVSSSSSFFAPSGRSPRPSLSRPSRLAPPRRPPRGRPADPAAAEASTGAAAGARKEPAGARPSRPPGAPPPRPAAGPLATRGETARSGGEGLPDEGAGAGGA